MKICISQPQDAPLLSQLLRRHAVSTKTILVNATTINKGGGIQAVVAFIRLLLEEVIPQGGPWQWLFAVSGEVRDQLALFGHHLRPELDLCLEQSPARHSHARRQLQAYANSRADAVFTFFGPAYLRFAVPHLCGIADGWVTHSDRLAFAVLPSLRKKLQMFALCVYKGLWFRTADHWVVEQEAARLGCIRRLGVDPHRVHLVANNCAQGYLHYVAKPQVKALDSPLRILCFASYYPHKCLELIPAIAACLKSMALPFPVECVLTLPEASYAQTPVAKLAKALGVEDLVVNYGSIALQDGPALYQRCHIALLPSVLETFSAMYPEAMAMGVPIVTSDLPFAHSICGAAATYFEPRSAEAAARSIHRLLSDEPYRQSLIEAGYQRVAELPSAYEKYLGYCQALNQMLVTKPCK